MEDLVEDVEGSWMRVVLDGVVDPHSSRPFQK